MSSAVNVALVASGLKSPASMINIKGEDSDKAVTIVDNKAVLVGAAGTAGVCLTTYAVASNVLSDASALATTAFTPYVVYQKSELAELGSFREQQNRLRNTVNGVAAENVKLTKNVDALEGNVNNYGQSYTALSCHLTITRLEEVEKNLSKLANTDNIGRLVQVVKETKKINEKIKMHLQARISQDIITTVLRCDRDGNLVLNEREMSGLCFRLKNSPGYDFNEERFKKVIGKKDHADGYSIGQIMEVIRNLLDDDVPEEETIFKLKPEKNMKFM